MARKQKKRCDFEIITPNGKTEKCGRPEHWFTGKCVFHAELGDKSVKKFWGKFHAYLGEIEGLFKKAKNKEEIILDCRGFVFPETEERFVEKVFETKVDFSAAKFVGKAKFARTEFKRATLFEKAYFAEAAIFQGTKFLRNVDFSNAKFGGVAGFQATKFRDSATFEYAEFDNNAAFWGAKFYKNADFAGTKFKNTAGFSKAHFGGNAEFSCAELRKSAFFNGVKFDGYANFHATGLLKGIDFIGAHFTELADFTGSTIKGEANFERTVFEGEADFGHTFFEKDLNFITAKFLSRTSFRYAVFQGRLRFEETDFQGPTEFISARMQGPVIYCDTEFGKDISFVSAIFSGEAEFHTIKIAKAANFNGATFESLIEFYKITNDRSARPTVYFSSIKTGDHSRLVFTDCDLGNWSFAETYLLVNAFFADVSWSGGKGKKRKSTLDEDLAKKGDITYEAAVEVYRRLRRNFETRLSYAEAGDFHIGEMEMRRLGYERKGWKCVFKWNYLFLQAYRCFGAYGERLWRPIASFLGAGLFFTGLWKLIGFPIPEGETVKISHDLGYAILFSFKTFFTLPGKALCLVQECLGAFQRTIGVAIITLFILALRRAFRR